MITVSEIAEKLNTLAGELGPQLLPNGRRAGNKWMFSGIADTGKSESAWLNLSGTRIGHWQDAGNCRGDEEFGDMIDLLRLKRGLADQASAIEEAKAELRSRGMIAEDDWRPGQPRRTDPAELARRAAESRARTEARQAEEDAERAVKIKRAKALWLSGAGLAGTAGESYLLGRSIENPAGQDWPGAARFHSEVWHYQERVKVPAILNAIYRADGQQIGTHRTFLQAVAGQGWTKLACAKPKLVTGTMWGGFIPVAKGASGKAMAKMPSDEPVYVTEGWEDALVVRMMLPAARVVAAISLGNMGAIVLPPAARELVLVCDRDSKPEAQDQLERSIAQQQARGLAVRLVMPPAQYAGHPVKDVNDWWLAIIAANRANVRPADSMPPVSDFPKQARG